MRIEVVIAAGNELVDAPLPLPLHTPAHTHTHMHRSTSSFRGRMPSKKEAFLEEKRKPVSCQSPSSSDVFIA